MNNIKHLKKCKNYYYVGGTKLTKINQLEVNAKMKIIVLVFCKNNLVFFFKTFYYYVQ